MAPRAKLRAGLALVLAILTVCAVISHVARAHSPQETREQAVAWAYDYNHTLVLSEEEAEESYRIYSILLSRELPDWHLKRLAIEEWTQDMRPDPDGPLCLQAPKDQKALYQEEFDDFLAKNRSRHQLEYRFDLQDYLLLSPDQSEYVRRLFGPVLRRHPPPWSEDDRKLYHDINVVFAVSEVGFNRDRTRAIVYIGHTCGGMCGEGTYHLLVKRQGKWRRDPDYRGTSCAWVV